MTEPHENIPEVPAEDLPMPKTLAAPMTAMLVSESEARGLLAEMKIGHVEDPPERVERYLNRLDRYTAGDEHELTEDSPYRTTFLNILDELKESHHICLVTDKGSHRTVVEEAAAKHPHNGHEQKSPARRRGRPKKAPAERAATTKQLSAVEAAYKLLARLGKPLKGHEIYERLVEKGWWISPTGQKPVGILTRRIRVEIETKGPASRFYQPAKGQYAVRSVEEKA